MDPLNHMFDGGGLKGPSTSRRWRSKWIGCVTRALAAWRLLGWLRHGLANIRRRRSGFRPNGASWWRAPAGWHTNVIWAVILRLAAAGRLAVLMYQKKALRKHLRGRRNNDFVPRGKIMMNQSVAS